MSAYICDDTTINTVLSHLNMDEYQALASAAVEDDALRAAQPGDFELGAALRALNERAVAERYPGEPVEALPGPVPYAPFAYAPLLVGAVPAYKALRCLLYQCSEGSVPETPLYRALDALSDAWAHATVCALPAYDAAPWG